VLARPSGALTVAALSVVGFLSGAAALVFEGLWFRLAGLALGNSVWASSLVVAAFMAGLGLGNATVARHGARLTRPLRAYAALEATIGVTGLAVVLLLPALTPSLAGVFRPLLDSPAILNAARLATALLLMLVPATAMGATLPLVVAAVSRDERGFGRLLAWLYGWNTLGGVAGALLGETVLVGAFGLRGAGLVAAGLNLTAAAGALALARRVPPAAEGDASPSRVPRRLLAAAALSGATLLALEVVWFRFLVLFVQGTSLAFAVMLAVVLLGIGAGGLLASGWLAAREDADTWLPTVALAAGAALIFSYAVFQPGEAGTPAWRVFVSSVRLMLPVSAVSGLLFALLGRAVRRVAAVDTAAAGHLTMANTAGATLGALLGGFVLLPGLGVERSLFALALSYLVVATLAVGRRPGPQIRAPLVVAAAVFTIAVVLFPFGLLHGRHLRRAWSPFLDERTKVAAVREGTTETITYLRTDWGGRPQHYTMLTNGYSMSSTALYARRYMKLYVYWALAARPEARKALLICYGVGNTAKALVDSARLTSIDVVDISKDVLDLSRVPYPPPARTPLEDPRVRLHLEDGRFFLLTAPGGYDLITGEPPPPKNAGVVNLYSREYFQLVHDRLAEGGVATYWLPVHSLDLGETKAILRGFCSAFPDCSLWSGGGDDWMMVGIRGGRRRIPLEALSRQWLDPAVRAEMATLGLEGPEDLGATFMADAPQIAAWAGPGVAIEDDRPHRLSGMAPETDPALRAFADAGASRKRFEESGLVAAMWPPEIRESTLGAFEFRRMVDDDRAGTPPAANLAALRRVLTGSRREFLPLLLLDVDPTQIPTAHEAHARGVRDPALSFTLAAEALSRRDYARAAELFEAAQQLGPGLPVAPYRDLARDLGAVHSPP
jgi:spermidine synthase